MSIAKHYETGECLPEDIYQKLLAARTFRAGSLSLRQVHITFTVLSILINSFIYVDFVLLNINALLITLFRSSVFFWFVFGN